MTISERVWTLLSRDPVIQAHIGVRIYPNKAPSNAAYPLLVFSVVDEVDQNTLNDGSDLVNARLQVDCYGRDGHYKEVQRLADEVKAVLHDYRVIGFSSMQVMRRNVYEDTGQQALHRVICEFDLWVNEEA